MLFLICQFSWYNFHQESEFSPQVRELQHNLSKFQKKNMILYLILVRGGYVEWVFSLLRHWVDMDIENFTNLGTIFP